jgi:glyoxylase-like metal-dependent hydrolase (beta-lactamase superfamily II)
MSGQRAQTTVLNDGIVAVDTEYQRLLHDASHLIVEAGRAAYVDTGVNSSVPFLLDALAQQDLDVADVDYVFLTHVHLDHAGGAGQLMQRLPNAKCVVHPYGARHMVDPTKLIAGTEAVYGKAETEKMYGRIEAIDEKRIVIPEDEQWFALNGRQLQTIFTEGHARHHYVLNDPHSKGVFTGDSFGVSYREHDTEKGEIVFPTTTPVQFDPVEAHRAVDRIMACDPDKLYLTHYSRVQNLDRLVTQMHEGIDAYVAMAREHENDEPEALRTSLFDYYVQRLSEHGYSGGREAIQSALGNDVDLNSQGLETWLKRSR